MTNRTKNTSPGRHFNAGHKAVSRMVTYALTLMDTQSLVGLAFIVRARLSQTERLYLAAAVLEALDDREYWHLVQWAEDDGFPAEGRAAA